MDNFSRSQVIRKTVVPTRGGVVAAAHRRAAEVGASVLDAGGDAVDAAVAVSFAIGVVEPWMSGPAAGGAMVLWRTGEGRARVVDYGMRSPMALDPADYPLTGGESPKELFTWPAVLNDRNVEGATAVAVPGVVSGMGLAHAEYGRMPWRDLVAPAVTLAKEGLLVDWFSTLLTTSVARSLASDPDAARMFLDDGTWPISGGWSAVCDRHLDQSAMAVTLERLAQNGPREFYEGEVARALVRDLQAKGSRMAEADLAGYQARIVDAQTVPYRDGRIYVAPGLTGGPTLAHALNILEAGLKPARGTPGAASYVAYAHALDQAFNTRLAGMGEWARRRPRRSRTGAVLHHAFQHRGSPRQHVLGHADAAVDFRLTRGVAFDRPAAEQRHHVVRPGAGEAQLARAGQALLGQFLSDHRRRRTAVASRSAPRAGARSSAR